MTLSRHDKQPAFQRLGVRLAFALGFAVLPLGVISALQSQSLIVEARARSAATLMGETLMAAGPATRLIRSARVTAEALSVTVPELAANNKICVAALKQLQARSDGAYSAIVFVPMSGDAQCNTNDMPMDLSKSPRLRQLAIDPKPDTVVFQNGRLSGTSVLAVGNPVFDQGGQLLGYVSISIPHRLLNGPLDPGEARMPSGTQRQVSLTVFDEKGTVLTSTAGLDDANTLLPRDVALASLVENPIRTFTATANDGNERIFAVFPLADDGILAIGSWPLHIAGDAYGMWIEPYLMPILTGLGSFLVALLASERLVARHMRSLRRAIINFADGNHRIDDLNLNSAAIEFRDVEEAYLKMTYTILRNEAELEDMVHQREVLLREVHHRVKNNLQLISSIINMQMRQSHSPDARILMKGLQDRVMSLATIHRGLYQTTGLADVQADELLTDIVRQILKMSTGPGRVYDVTTDFDDLRLTPDQAVPLSLLLTEALTNALKYAGTDRIGLPSIAISLRRIGGAEAELLVTNTVKAQPDLPPAEEGTRLGSKLLAAFGQQLAARSVTTHADGSYSLSVRFTVQSLMEGEARTDPVAASPDAPDGVAAQT